MVSVMSVFVMEAHSLVRPVENTKAQFLLIASVNHRVGASYSQPFGRLSLFGRAKLISHGGVQRHISEND